MVVDVTTAIEVRRSRSEVAEFAANPSNAPKWYVNIKSVEWRGDADLKVGAEIDFVAHFMGRRLAYTYQVVEYDPGYTLVMRTSSGPFPMRTEYRWSELPRGGTRMTLRNVGRPRGFGRVAAPLMRLAVRRANRKDLELLKAIMEAQRDERRSGAHGTHLS